MASVENLNPLQQTLREVKLFIPRSNILTAKGVLRLRKVCIPTQKGNTTCLYSNWIHLSDQQTGPLLGHTPGGCLGCSHAWCAEDNPESPSPRLHRGDVPVSCIIMGWFFAFKNQGDVFFLNISSQSSGYPGRFPVFFPLPQQQLWGFGGRLTAEGSAVRIPVPSRIRFENPYPSTKSTKKQKKIIPSLLGYFVGLTVCVFFLFFCLGQIDVWIPFGSLGDPKLQPNFSRLFRGEYIQGI